MNKSQYPHLASMARDYLAVPGNIVVSLKFKNFIKFKLILIYFSN